MTNHRWVYQEVDNRNEVLKTMLTGSGPTPCLLSPHAVFSQLFSICFPLYFGAWKRLYRSLIKMFNSSRPKMEPLRTLLMLLGSLNIYYSDLHLLYNSGLIDNPLSCPYTFALYCFCFKMSHWYGRLSNAFDHSIHTNPITSSFIAFLLFSIFHSYSTYSYYY